MLQIVASSTLIPGLRKVVEDATWEDLAYVITSPAAIYSDVNHMVGRLSFESLGAGEIRVLEENNVLKSYALEQADDWAKQGLTIPGPLSDVPVRYTIQARLNGSPALALRGMTASLLVIP